MLFQRLCFLAVDGGVCVKTRERGKRVCGSAGYGERGEELFSTGELCQRWRGPEHFMIFVRCVLSGGSQDQQWARDLLFSVLSEGGGKINDELWYIRFIAYGLRCLMT